MGTQIITLDERLYQYMLSVSLKEPAVLTQLREETARDPMAVLQIPADQGQFMALLVKLMGARRILEIGTYMGFSALSMALALPEDGYLLACDINREWTNVARRYWQKAGVADRIELRIAPALETMDTLLADGQEGCFDLIFIDADKPSYCVYYETGLRLLRSGGLVILDNVLWKGRVADDREQDPDTVALRAINSLIFQDERVDASIIPIGDGMTLARKR
jgi:predicted O-methyltransferase YrrM